MRRAWLPPPTPRSSPWWVLASALAHVAVIVLVLASTRRTFPGEPTIVMLLPGGPDASAVEMPWDFGPTTGRPGGQPDARTPRGAGGQADRRTAAPEVVPDSVPTTQPPDRPGEEARAVGPPGRAGEAEEPGPAAPPEGGRPGRVLGARFGDGRLWVRPWDAIAAAIVSAGRDSIGPASHVALIDSAITARLLTFLDALPADSFAVQRAPSWVTEINGQKWGVDGSWIYLGGLKLPSAILALLPLPGGNYDESKRAAELARIRDDIMRAARRAEDTEQFRKNVNETRARRDAEREAKKNQRVPPDSIKT